jgi:hypothetical protein
MSNAHPDMTNMYQLSQYYYTGNTRVEEPFHIVGLNTLNVVYSYVPIPCDHMGNDIGAQGLEVVNSIDSLRVIFETCKIGKSTDLPHAIVKIQKKSNCIQFARLKVIIAEVPPHMNEWTERLLQQYSTSVHPLDANRYNAFGEYRIVDFGVIENKIIHLNIKLNDPNDPYGGHVHRYRLWTGSIDSRLGMTTTMTSTPTKIGEIYTLSYGVLDNLTQIEKGLLHNNAPALYSGLAFIKVGVSMNRRDTVRKIHLLHSVPLETIRASSMFVRDPPALENHVKEQFWDHRYLSPHPIPQYPIREFYHSLPQPVVETFIDNEITPGAQHETSRLNANHMRGPSVWERSILSRENSSYSIPSLMLLLALHLGLISPNRVIGIIEYIRLFDNDNKVLLRHHQFLTAGLHVQLQYLNWETGDDGSEIFQRSLELLAQYFGPAPDEIDVSDLVLSLDNHNDREIIERPFPQLIRIIDAKKYHFDHLS